MLRFEPFKEAHAYQLDEQGATFELRAHLSPDMFQTLERDSPIAYTAFNSENRIVACAGVIEYWKNRGEAWALLDKNCKKEFLHIHRAVRRGLDLCPLKRVEAVVERRFTEGHRWVYSLGFMLEAPRMRSYHPNGQDCSLYSRIRRD